MKKSQKLWEKVEEQLTAQAEDEIERREQRYWQSLQPHPEHGNIYYPHRIVDQGNLRYNVVDSNSTTVKGPVSWAEAVSHARILNDSQEA